MSVAYFRRCEGCTRSGVRCSRRGWTFLDRGWLCHSHGDQPLLNKYGVPHLRPGDVRGPDRRSGMRGQAIPKRTSAGDGE